MLAVIGMRRSWFGEKTGGVLWADVHEHSIPHAPQAYGLNRVFQVFGHTRLNGARMDKVEYGHFAMIDSQQCFVVDEGIDERIVGMRNWENMEK